MPDKDTSENSVPAISVIIPAYKAATHIGSALDSVFAQTFTDFEAILVNDGSPDSKEMESVIAPYLPRITYLKQPNQGPSAARNLGIRHARGAFLAFLDADDTWLPEYLAQQMLFLQSDSSLHMVYSDALFLGDTPSSGKTFMELCPSTGPVTFESLLTEQTQVITSGTVVRRQAVIDAGGFDENFRCAEDHDLWLRLAYRGCRIAYQRRALVHHLIRPDSQGSPPGSLIAGEVAVLKKIEREFQLDSNVRSLMAEKLRNAEFLLAWTYGKNSLFAGDHQAAYKFFLQAKALASTPKLRALLLSLRIAPRLTASGAKAWARLSR